MSRQETLGGTENLKLHQDQKKQHHSIFLPLTTLRWSSHHQSIFVSTLEACPIAPDGPGGAQLCDPASLCRRFLRRHLAIPDSAWNEIDLIGTPNLPKTSHYWQQR